MLRKLSALVVSSGDGAIDLEVTKHTLDAISLAIESFAVRIVDVRLDFGGMTGLMPRSLKSARIASVS
jgi:hypothetical protein